MKIAVLGHGTVGSGLCEILTERSEEMAKAAERPLSLGYVTDLKKFPETSYADKFTDSFETVLNDPEVGIVAEAIGGIEPAFSYLKAALEQGKSAVTSNKELVAEKGAELLAVARAHNANFLFEASVGGGIPLIRPLYSAMNAAGITEIAGILNGTTNYILTQMFEHGADYSEALSNAQRLGYAEADPSADVLGLDACRKIAILASLVWGSTLKPEEIATEGIDKITGTDVKIANESGYSIKLIARAKLLQSGKIASAVSPMLVPKSCPLSNVSGVFNAVLVKAQTAGEVLFYGRGAGKMPTASAMAADIVECAKAPGNIKSLFWEDGAQSVADENGIGAQKYYIRTESAFSEYANRLFPETKQIGEHAFITPVLKKDELDALTENLPKVLAKIPVFE